MSVALAAAPLKTDVRLAQAVSEFEAELSSEHKSAFRALRSKTCETPPGIQDVMQLTAEIGQQTNKSLGPGCSFGPRMTNILQAIQQFAAIGDVVVGGSQNIIACSVWALARFTLLSIVYSASTLDKLSALLMMAGRSAPRHERMALLYPQSTHLQSYLHEYFIVVVHLCHHVFKFSKKSVLGQLVSAWVLPDMSSFQSDLDRWAGLIEQEVKILAIEEQKVGFKSLLRFSKFETNRRRLQSRTRILDACSTYDHQTPWKQTRKIGNATLFHQYSAYTNWKDSLESSTLLLSGKLGSGKSVLMANVVDDLNLCKATADCPVAYFFCRHDISESLTTSTILGSLARQLLSPIVDLSKVEDILDAANSSPDPQAICNLILRALPPGSKAYIVLDGLDICDSGETVNFLHHVRTLQRTFTIRLCASFTLNANTDTLKSEQFGTHTIIRMPEQNLDIENYVNAELGRRIEALELTVGDPALIMEIQDTLLSGAQGMFLWVALQIDSLCAAKTDAAIRKTLAELPKDLPETFFRILQESAQSGKDYQTRTLELVTVARRPLTTGELREALSVVVGDAEWDPTRQLNDVTSALASCGTLITVDEEDATVRLIHHSVKKFLFGGYETLEDTVFSDTNAETTMTGIIITYLHYNVFETQVSRAAVPPIKGDTAPKTVVQSTGMPSAVRNLALQYLKQSTGPSKFHLGKAIEEASARFKQTPSANHFLFHHYAKKYWRAHVNSCRPFKIGFQAYISILNVPAEAGDNHSIKHMLMWAMATRQLAVTKLLLDKGVRVEYTNTALLLAAVGRDAPLVRLLLEKGVNIEAKDSPGQSALF